MKAGDRVRVYEDPETKRRYEGTAVLVHPMDRTADGSEWWTVRFPGPYERNVVRWVDAMDVVTAEVAKAS